MLDNVMLALHHIEGLTGVSTMGVHGFGRDRSLDDREISLETKPHVKIDTACTDALAEAVLSTIAAAAHTGLRGDGKFMSCPLNRLCGSAVESAVKPWARWT